MGAKSYSLVFCVTLFVLLAATGCKEGDTVLIMPGNEPPEIADIADQNATEGTPFTLDLSSSVTDKRDDVTELTFTVISGGGQFTDTTYLNTFYTPGTAVIPSR